jgi:acetolactate synthase-1/2/3 large subunit
VRVDVPIVGDVRDVLQELVKQLGTSGAKPDAAALKTWWAQIEMWRARDSLKYDRSSPLIKPQYVIQKLHEVTRGNAYVTSDVGQHQMWAAQFYKFEKPRRWINSGGLGTMGFGLPAAMGVQLAHPEATVACVTGESSIMMCIQELSTCRQYRLPLKIVSLNNRYMGMVRQWQEFFHGNRYAESYMDALPDFMSSSCTMSCTSSMWRKACFTWRARSLMARVMAVAGAGSFWRERKALRMAISILASFHGTT